MREQLDELERLHAAAKSEKTTIAICAYRRALLRAGDALLEYVRQLEGERDSYRKQCSDLLNGIALAGAEGDARMKRGGAAEWLDGYLRGLSAGNPGAPGSMVAILEEELQRLREGK